MTPAERLVDALLARDVARLRALRGDPALAEVVLAEVVQVALDRLDPAPTLSDAELAALRAVAGHPGLSAAELADVAPGFVGAAPRLLELGLVTDRRFERGDCWSRTALGAQVLRGSSTPA